MNRLLALDSIRAKLLAAFLVFAILFLLTNAIFSWYTSIERGVLNTTDKLRVVQDDFYKALVLDRDFYISERKSVSFHELARIEGDSIYQKNPYLLQHEMLIYTTVQNLDNLKKSIENLSVPALETKIDSVIQGINDYEKTFRNLVEWIIKHGFEDYGYEGEMRRTIDLAMNSGYLDRAQVLQVRRYGEDYMMRGESVYIEKLSKAVEALKQQIKNSPSTSALKDSVAKSLTIYEASFHSLIEANQKITGENGLRSGLTALSDQIQSEINDLVLRIKTKAETVRNQVYYAMIGVLVTIIGVVFLLSFVVSNNLSKPIEALSASLNQVVEDDFTHQVEIPQIKRRDEIGNLAKDFDIMLRKVRERNTEINRQKEEIAQSYETVKLLRTMGQEITASLVIETIIDTIRTNIKKLIEIDVFLMGTYHEENQSLRFRGAMVQDKRLDTFEKSLADHAFLPVWCFNNQREVVSNDVSREIETIFQGFKSIIGNSRDVKSVVYLPLITKSKKLGVISIQSFEEDAFSDYQINILRNLAIYAVIALDNALVYENLEDTVLKRTATIREQADQLAQSREDIEKAYTNIKLLSEIGSTLTTYLSAETIIEQVYEHFNQLMDAKIFGIGIVKEEEEYIEFEGAIEHGKKVPSFRQHFNDTNSFSAYSYKNAEEVVVNDWEIEMAAYSVNTSQIITEEQHPQSFVFIPLMVKDGRIIAILSIQSIEKNAYRSQQLNIIRSLGTYIAIALENAEAYHQVELVNEKVEKSNKKITASINYASRIQQAILPNINDIKSAVDDAFIMLMPRDIVSGDFYWYAKKNGKIIIAAVDCTGHGVPGAFMSTVGINILFHVVRENGITRPDLILNEMHREVKSELKQDENNNRDGMDAAICTIDPKAKTMQFAGAKNPLIYFQADQIHEIKGDKMPIGGRQIHDDRLFTYHEIDISTPVSFYIFSDGFQDQFGGLDQRKYTRKRLRKTLMQIQQHPMEEQYIFLKQHIDEWMKGPRDEHGAYLHEKNRQIDDILVIGARIGG